ncbi:MAG: sulfite exporter TauE/SafE family protein, partial [Propionibacteriaceae bacterium]|nr:sulfite exporter TauE/SafE family protein [Propionibacteriaceae bacterium]
GIVGASLLLHFSAEVFAAVVPWLIGIGTILVIAGPAIKRRIDHAGPEPAEEPPRRDGVEPFPTRVTVGVSVAGAFFLGVYGG